jgi:hypothetical protein
MFERKSDYGVYGWLIFTQFGATTYERNITGMSEGVVSPDLPQTVRTDIKLIPSYRIRVITNDYRGTFCFAANFNLSANLDFFIIPGVVNEISIGIFTGQVENQDTGFIVYIPKVIIPMGGEPSPIRCFAFPFFREVFWKLSGGVASTGIVGTGVCATGTPDSRLAKGLGIGLGEGMAVDGLDVDGRLRVGVLQACPKMNRTTRGMIGGVWISYTIHFREMGRWPDGVDSHTGPRIN